MYGTHLIPQLKHSQLQTDSTLHVIGVISNPVRWHSRIRLFNDWKKKMLSSPNIKLYVVEALYMDRMAECKPENGENYEYLSVKTDSEIWLKENLINIGIKNLFPRDWRYLAWVDCDVEFSSPTWALQTIHQLQHYNIVQPWSDALDLDAQGGLIQAHKSFGSLCANRKPINHGNLKYGQYGHTGYAVACTRYFYENVEKLLDFCIIGSGDHHILWACVGDIISSINPKVCDDYKKACYLWQAKASRACAKLVGFVQGRVTHFYHGAKKDRNYWGRWDILLQNNFDPLKDLGYDSQGVLKLIGTNKEKIEQAVMLYNRSRMEDSV